MKGQGSSSLWLLTIGLIAIFMVATMVAPALLNQNKADTKGTDNTSGNNPQTLMFDPPTIVLSPSTIEQEEMANLSMRTMPETPTTGDGGSFAWIVSIEGANGQGSKFLVHYGDQMVQWFANKDGTLVGIGPRFTQGPGAASVEVSANFSLVADLAGSFTIKAWIAEAKDLITLDPANLTARSPVQSKGFQVTEKASPEASVVQSLSGPDSAKKDSWVKYTLTSQGHATGKWKSSVTEFIAITKSRISSGDVLARVLTDKGSRSISWIDNGDRLVGMLQTSTPFKGTTNTESVEWTTSFELDFRTTGSYKIECWSVESGTEKALGPTITHDIEVRLTSDAPAIDISSEPKSNISAPSSGNTTATSSSPTNGTNRT